MLLLVSGTVYPSKAKLRPVDNFESREHTQGKMGVEANRLENSLAGDVLAIRIPANGRVIAVDGEMLLPIFGSGIDHGVFLFNKLETKEVNQLVSLLLKREK